MTDSHAHLVMQPLSNNLPFYLKEFRISGGLHILNTSFDPESINAVIETHLKYQKIFPSLIQTSIGIHPEHFTNIYSTEHDIYTDTKKALDNFENTLHRYKGIISAIGETGLDYYHIKNDKTLNGKKIEELIEIQKYSFTKHIELAIKYNLPLSIHTRDADNEHGCIKDALELIAKIGKGVVSGSFHSYTGPKDYVEDILNLNFFIGFNGILTYPKAENVREIARITPIDRTLLETDCPFLPPQNVRKKKDKATRFGTPKDIIEITEFLKKIKAKSKEDINKKILENYISLFLRD